MWKTQEDKIGYCIQIMLILCQTYECNFLYISYNTINPAKQPIYLNQILTVFLGETLGLHQNLCTMSSSVFSGIQLVCKLKMMHVFGNTVAHKLMAVIDVTLQTYRVVSTQTVRYVYV